jgi:hypothetical protein
MSGMLTIHFAADMPTIAVDVIAPDLSVVERMMMSPNDTKTVPVPSEASLLRMHLPSGRTVILSDPGNLSRTVEMAALQTQGARPAVDPDTSMFLSDQESMLPGASEVIAQRRRRETRFTMLRQTPLREGSNIQHAQRTYTAQIISEHNRGAPQWGTPISSNEHAWSVGGDAFGPPREFQVSLRDGRFLRMQLPGNIRRVWLRADDLADDSIRLYSIRLESEQPIADTILNYMKRGDLGAASAMDEWAALSGDLLFEKHRDPYSAAVGAYMLLRLGRFDLLRDWPHNLADRFEYLPDGSILWASQLIQAGREPEQIRKYLFDAVKRGLPAYTEGVRLLLDGLRLLGDEGQEKLEAFRSELHEIVWNSPLSARIVNFGPPSEPAERPDLVKFDIAFAAPV